MFSPNCPATNIFFCQTQSDTWVLTQLCSQHNNFKNWQFTCWLSFDKCHSDEIITVISVARWGMLKYLFIEHAQYRGHNYHTNTITIRLNGHFNFAGDQCISQPALIFGHYLSTFFKDTLATLCLHSQTRKYLGVYLSTCPKPSSVTIQVRW